MNNIEKIVLGGGCFWCLDAAFSRVGGVKNVMVGYSGGEKENPNYDQVCMGKTGHAEVVEVEFDNSIISLGGILDVFFKIHDPTTLNRQGADVGTQYRSVIYYENEEQKKIVEEKIKELNEKKYDGKIVTEVGKLKEFFIGEEYHQKYFDKNPENAYCQIVIAPKLAKL